MGYAIYKISLSDIKKYLNSFSILDPSSQSKGRVYFVGLYTIIDGNKNSRNTQIKNSHIM